MLSPNGASARGGKGGQASPTGGPRGGGGFAGFTSASAALAWLAVTLVLVGTYGVAFRAAGSRRVSLSQPGAPAGAVPCDDECFPDPLAPLDEVGENPPPIVDSHYKRMFGMEPFERLGLTPFDLHVVPTDDWYVRAKNATDRCDLELSEQVTGAEKGLADKVVWVSGLFDLKRGEGGNGEFVRPMSEYFARFQRILDRGSCPPVLVQALPAKHLPSLALALTRCYPQASRWSSSSLSRSRSTYALMLPVSM